MHRPHLTVEVDLVAFGMGNDSTAITQVDQASLGDCTWRDACLVVINGADLGKKYCLVQVSTVIGRSSKVDIQIDEDAVSRNHAVIERDDNRFVVRDLESTNGTYVNDCVVREKALVDGDQITIGRTILKFLAGSNIEANYHEEIYRLTTTDELTQVYNKRYFLQEMAREMGQAVRCEGDLALILCDIDCFKATNDTFGHLAGDYVLQRVAQHIQRHIRRGDICGRYGGEEFVVLLPGLNKSEAAARAEQLRKLVESERFEFDNATIPITLSLGVADLHESRRAMTQGAGDSAYHITCFTLIKLADERLYRAKNSGRNLVVADGWDPAPRPLRPNGI